MQRSRFGLTGAGQRGIIIGSATLGAVGIHRCEDTLPTHDQLVVHQDPLFVLCGAAPQPAGHSLYCCMRLVTDAVTSVILVKLFGMRILVHFSLLSPENLSGRKYLFCLQSGIE